MIAAKLGRDGNAAELLSIAKRVDVDFQQLTTWEAAIHYAAKSGHEVNILVFLCCLN